MHRRNVVRKLSAALAVKRVVLLKGVLQVDERTLAQQVARQRGGRYPTLDDPTTAELARYDPAALVNGAAQYTVIDQGHSALALLHAIKREVDRRPGLGRFVLISANVFIPPNAAESLAGRMEVLALEPLSQFEVEALPHDFVDVLFGSPPRVRPGRADLAG